MDVHRGVASKDDVMKAQKEEFMERFGMIAKQNDLIKASNKVISDNIEQFNQLKKSVAVDPARQMFFASIENGISCQKDLENMLSQGLEFYQRLIDHLMQLK